MNPYLTHVFGKVFSKPKKKWLSDRCQTYNPPVNSLVRLRNFNNFAAQMTTHEDAWEAWCSRVLAIQLIEERFTRVASCIAASARLQVLQFLKCSFRAHLELLATSFPQHSGRAGKLDRSHPPPRACIRSTAFAMRRPRMLTAVTSSESAAFCAVITSR